MNKGDFTLDSLNCQNFHLQTNTGDISLRSLQTKRGAISDKDGDISIIDSSLENMKLDASLGDLSAEESNFTDSILHYPPVMQSFPMFHLIIIARLLQKWVTLICLS